MSMTIEDSIKHWTAKRKTGLVIQIIQGMTTVSEARRSFDLSLSEIEIWIEDAKRGTCWAGICHAQSRPPRRPALWGKR